MFPVSESSSSSNVFSPASSSDVVISAIASLLRPLGVFSLEFFQLPLFPVATLYETAKLYGCHEISVECVNELHLKDQDRKDNSILTLVWFSHVIGCNGDSTGKIVSQYKCYKKFFRLPVNHKKPLQIS